MNPGNLKRGIAASLLLCGLSFIAASNTFAQALPKGVTQGPSVEGITEYRLPDGLKVLLFPDASKPTVTVNMTYLVGSRHENYGETGMAHLLEHMMFKGATKYPDITKQFAERGMQFNGTTSNDRTNYFEVFKAGDDNLKWAIGLEAARMTHSFVSRKDLDSEMTVVRNEFERGENDPFHVMLKRMESIAYDWHSYGRDTIGNRSDIENVKIANLQAFYHMYYQPDNAVLLVAGKFDAAKTLGWIATAFAPVAQPKRVLPPFWTVEPTQDGERSFTVRRQGDYQLVALAYKIPSGLHPDSKAVAVMSEILGDTPNGRLHKLLVTTGKSVQVFSFGMTGYAPGLQIIGAVVKKGEPIEPVRDALIAAVESFAKTPPTPEEMERVKRNDANAVEKTLNNHEQIGVRLSESIALGDWRMFFQKRDQIAKVTPEQVTAVAAHYLTRDNRVVGNFLPDDAPQRADIPAAPTVADVLKDFKGKADTLTAEAFDPTQANIDARTQHKTIGGLKLALLPKKNRGETVSVHLNLHWGDEKNLFGKNMVASMTDAMLMNGTSKYTREQLADEFQKLKISGRVYQFDTTRSNLPNALKLVAHVLKEANFPETEFEQLRKNWIVGLEAERNEPQEVAGRAKELYFNAFPKGDPRAATSLEDDLADVKAATLADVKAFHRDFYGASNGELAIVGDFDVAQVVAAVDESFGKWASHVPYAYLPKKNIEVAALSKTINTPDKENGVYTARLNLDLRTDDADYPALQLANYVFGGGELKSRIMDRIRQKDGLSYGGGSGVWATDLDRAGNFYIDAIAAPQNLKKVEAAIREELERAVKDGFTAEEIKNAKSGLLQLRLQSRAQDAAVANQWANYLFLNRTFTWSQAFEDKIAALTVEQVNAAFRKAIDPSKLSVFIADDEAKAKAAAVAPKP